MKPKREYSDFLRDILDMMEKIDNFTKGMTFNQFAEDDKTNFAVFRAIEIIGEAAKNIPKLAYALDACVVFARGRAWPTTRRIRWRFAISFTPKTPAATTSSNVTGMMCIGRIN